MALLTILEFPDPRLRTRAAEVKAFDARLKQLVGDMFDTMYAAPGIGLAATQVDVHQRVIVMYTGGKEAPNPRTFINPRILGAEGEEVMEEGCLSVPTIFEEVKRAAKVLVRAQDVSGATFTEELDGLTAVCLQHEMDHLEGKLFVDYLSATRRELIRSKLEKDQRARGGAPPVRSGSRSRAI